MAIGAHQLLFNSAARTILRRSSAVKRFESIHPTSFLMARSLLKNHRLFFSSGTSSSSSTTSTPFWRRSSFWKRFAWLVRTLRIPIVVVSVFSLGYQQGIIECTKHPQILQQRVMNTMLQQYGIRDLDTEVYILSEQDISYLNPHLGHQVAAVGHRIVSSARALVQEELEQAMAAVQEKLPDDITPQQAQEYLDNDDTVQLWYDAALRLMGEVDGSTLLLNVIVASENSSSSSSGGSPVGTVGASPLEQAAAVTNQAAKAVSGKQRRHVHKLSQQQRVPWQYVFIGSDVPNAFVSELLPQRIFITTGMLELATSPDELAMVLGHEISHLVLGHVTVANQVEMMLRTAEVLLLSLDPTSGVLSLVFVGALAALRSALTAAMSRENETEADELGLKIAARACFDTVAGSEVMYKMHQQVAKLSSPSSAKKEDVKKDDEDDSADSAKKSSRVQLFATHPPTLERYERLKQAAMDGENYTKYQSDQCATLGRRIITALGWGGNRKKSSKQE